MIAYTRLVLFAHSDFQWKKLHVQKDCKHIVGKNRLHYHAAKLHETGSPDLRKG